MISKTDNYRALNDFDDTQTSDLRLENEDNEKYQLKFNENCKLSTIFVVNLDFLFVCWT